jgi:putative acetyltransferase
MSARSPLRCVHIGASVGGVCKGDDSVPPIGLIRLEDEGDAPAIRDLLEAAFPDHAEADLVDALRRMRVLVLSLVAEADGYVVGHVGFARIFIESEAGRSRAVALAPLAVYAEYQDKGIATRLVREAHAVLASRGETLSVVLGDPNYYRRFGYTHARAAGFESDYQSPYLMAISFGAAPHEGRLIYPPPFAALSDDAPIQAHDRV